MSTIAERVAAGAAWLDEHRPGWVDRIDLDTLDLGDPCRCVLGQLYGGYIKGRHVFDADGVGSWWRDTETAAECGLHAIADVAGGGLDSDVEYVRLTTAWRALILARRAEAPARGVPTFGDIAREKRLADV